MATVDYFLKLDGIEGESQDYKHKGEIDVESFSWGVSQAGTMGHGGGGGAGKATFQDFHFTMKGSKATPKLMLNCATGTHIKKAVLTARKAGKEQQEFLKITFTDMLVTMYNAGGTGGGAETSDQCALNFAKIEFEYKEQKPDGTLGGAVKSGYDVKANKMI